MAKPSKYSRARIRARVRRQKRGGGSQLWVVAIVGIVVVGVALIVLSKGSSAEESPKVGQHWHAFLDVNACGDWLGPAPQFEQRANQASLGAGLHSHADYLMHIEPSSGDEAGKYATVGRFFEYGGWDLSGTSVTAWDGVKRTNGDSCGTGAGSKKATLQWKVGEYGKPWPKKARTGNPAGYRPKNGEIVAVYFVPKGERLAKPPSADQALSTISDIAGRSGVTTTSTTAGTSSTTPGSSTP